MKAWGHALAVVCSRAHGFLWNMDRLGTAAERVCWTAPADVLDHQHDGDRVSFPWDACPCPKHRRQPLPAPPFCDLEPRVFRAIQDAQNRTGQYPAAVVELPDQRRYPGEVTLWLQGGRRQMPIGALLEMVLQAVPLLREEWLFGRLPADVVPDWLLASGDE